MSAAVPASSMARFVPTFAPSLVGGEEEEEEAAAAGRPAQLLGGLAGPIAAAGGLVGPMEDGLAGPIEADGRDAPAASFGGSAKAVAVAAAGGLAGPIAAAAAGGRAGPMEDGLAGPIEAAGRAGPMPPLASLPLRLSPPRPDASVRSRPLSCPRKPPLGLATRRLD